MWHSANLYNAENPVKIQNLYVTKLHVSIQEQSPAVVLCIQSASLLKKRLRDWCLTVNYESFANAYCEEHL